MSCRAPVGQVGPGPARLESSTLALVRSGDQRAVSQWDWNSQQSALTCGEVTHYQHPPPSDHNTQRMTGYREDSASPRCKYQHCSLPSVCVLCVSCHSTLSELRPSKLLQSGQGGEVTKLFLGNQPSTHLTGTTVLGPSQYRFHLSWKCVNEPELSGPS